MRSGRLFLFLAVLLAASAPAFAAPSNPAPATAISAPAESAEDLRLPPGERLLKQLDKSYGVTLGSKAEAPVLYAMISPNIPACKDFWRAIRDDVKAGHLNVRLFPAGLQGSDNERAAAELLSAADPLTAWDAWDKFALGDAHALAGTPDAAAIEKVRANTALVKAWRLPVAPYLLYRAKDGRMKVVQGAPSNPKAMIFDLGAPSEGNKP